MSSLVRLARPDSTPTLTPSKLDTLPDQALQTATTTSPPAPESVEQDAWSDIESDDDIALESQIEDVEHDSATEQPLDVVDDAQTPTSSSHAQDHFQENPLFGLLTSLKLQPFPASPAFSAVNEPAISTPQRSSSAPPEEVAPRELRPTPRISDDTAILHAFLSRAAASKRPTPISKRESLSNRRDSDAVRQALASPAKNDILAELDPNSPSPRKPLLSPGNLDSDTAADCPTIVDASQISRAVTTTHVPSGEQRVMRRSIRSRSRLSNFTPLVEAASSKSSSAAAPNKITIRSATDRLTLKRTDAQELASQTRTNTRKNKGGSVMPVVRLCKLAAEAASPEVFADDTSSAVPTKTARGIRWDQTLVYFQEYTNESETQDLDSVEAGPQDNATLGDVIIASTPTKAWARRPKTVSHPAEPDLALETIAPSSEPELDDTAVAAGDTSKVQLPKKRRSRLATPAKALLAPASLLPTDVALSGLPNPSIPAKKSSASSLPAPRKLNLEGSLTDGKENRPTNTPKKSGIPSIKAVLPKLEPRTDAAAEAERPGLASPAKKRAKNGIPKSVPRAPSHREEDLQLPSLCSPAKKRVRPRVL